MVLGTMATFLTPYATTYSVLLLAALRVRIAGGSFSVGVAYVSKFHPPPGAPGLPLGIFGAGDVGSAVTKIVVPFVMVAMRWDAVARV